MLLRMWLLLAASGASSLPTNRSSRRHGKERLLEDLRALDAFRYRSSPCDDSNIVNVDFKYHYEILMVDEVEQAVSSVGYVSMIWRDRDLSWNKTEYGGVDMLSIPYDELWHPAITVFNALRPENMLIDSMQTMILFSNGQLICTSPVYLMTTCNMDLIYYPFDTQICSIIFLTAMDDVKYNISASPLGDMADRYSVTGEWTITSRNMTSLTVNGPLSATIISFTMNLERRPLFYVLCVLAPMILTALVTSVVFWIPPKSGEKISFLVTVFVSDTVFLNFIAGTMPRNMSSLPRLPLFLVLINIQCVFAMVATVFVMLKFEQEQKDLKNSQLHSSPDIDQTCSHGEKVAQITEPTQESYTNSTFKNKRSSYTFNKLSCRRVRVGPLEQNTPNKLEPQHRTHGLRSVRSTTWDKIFFCLFHTISVPCYYLLFKA